MRNLRWKSRRSGALRAALLTALTLLVAAFAIPRAHAAPVQLTHATYAAALRGADGHVDADAMVKSLTELGVGTYYWLIWQANDWDDLKAFLPKAQAAGIQVWPYLVPPTESVPHTKNYSEPFKLDYQLWGEEIAKLSLQFPNLTGWVIDDFYANHDFFTPDYLREMQRRMDAVNPKLAFLPLMYFNEIDTQFVTNYGPVIDGVVVAYPQDREEIAQARAVLDGTATVMPGQMRVLPSTPTATGDFVTISQTAAVSPGHAHTLRFHDYDDYLGPTAGYHFKQLLVDSEVVWEEDAAGGVRGWSEVTVDLAPFVKDKQAITLAFRIFEKQGVGNFGLRWRVSELRAEGFTPAKDLNDPKAWDVAMQGKFDVGYGDAIQPGKPRQHIPFVVMTAAQEIEFQLRHGDPATPARIGDWLKMCLEAQSGEQCDGVVTYCLDLKPGGEAYNLAKDLFHRNWK